MSDQHRGPSVVSPPHPAGARPHSGRRRIATRCLAGLTLPLFAGVFACESAEDAQLGAPVVLALGATEAPSYSDGELSLYESQAPVAFPIKKPTEAQMSGAAVT